MSKWFDEVRGLMAVAPGTWSMGDYYAASRVLQALRNGHRRSSASHTYARRALRKRRDAESMGIAGTRTAGPNP